MKLTFHNTSTIYHTTWIVGVHFAEPEPSMDLVRNNILPRFHQALYPSITQKANMKGEYPRQDKRGRSGMGQSRSL
ncbi:Os01g0243501 [Oryza sativa Japonica Group]|uniref:Os01g0243501 protein n=1 Tax=Oryza sativa subsp. japonica TaxID=39947 RepID=A0A0P0V0A9_ORYSJ|nr:Os01g0243501 [Oryza sativa Japonica Group]